MNSATAAAVDTSPDPDEGNVVNCFNNTSVLIDGLLHDDGRRCE